MEAGCLCAQGLAPVGFADRVASSRFASSSSAHSNTFPSRHNERSRTTASVQWGDKTLGAGFRKRARQGIRAEFTARDWDYRDAVARIPSPPIPDSAPARSRVVEGSAAGGARVTSLVAQPAVVVRKEYHGEQDEQFLGVTDLAVLNNGLSGVGLASEIDEQSEEEEEAVYHFEDDPTLWARRRLRKLPFFKHASLKALHELAAHMERRSFPAGGYIRSRGSAGLYLIERGEVVVMSSDGRDPETPGPGVALLGRGNCFGHEAGPGLNERLWPQAELELHVAGPRDVHVAGDEGVDCLFISAEDLRAGLRHELWLPANGSCFGRPSSSFPGCGPPHVLRALRLSDFRHMDMLGKGGFGHVGLVEHRRTGGLFALKCVNQEPSKDPFLANEIRIQGMLNEGHPFLGRFIKHFQWQGSTYILQEVMLGGDLHQLAREYDHGIMPLEHAKFYAACMVEAVAYLQSVSVAHRDLKLGNFMLDDEGYIKLVDFGYATKVPRGKATRGRVGTPSYVAPEIVRNYGHDMSVDLWSLGVAIYRLLGGKHPFDCLNASKTLARIKDPTPPPLPEDKFTPEARSLILGLLSQEPEDRLGWAHRGIEELRAHPFFAGIDWKALRNKELDAPYVPDIVHPWDTSRFRRSKERCVLDRMVLPTEKEEVLGMYEETYVGAGQLAMAGA